MKQELKEWLEPPFIYGDGYKWDWDTYHIRGYIDGEETAILKVMPIADHIFYNNLMGVEGRRKFIKDLTEFTIAALNEKWEREFGKPLRWILKEWKPFDNRLAVICPKCDSPFEYHAIEFSNFCPHCGQRLNTPAGK